MLWAWQLRFLGAGTTTCPVHTHATSFPPAQIHLVQYSSSSTAPKSPLWREKRPSAKNATIRVVTIKQKHCNCLHLKAINNRRSFGWNLEIWKNGDFQAVITSRNLSARAGSYCSRASENMHTPDFRQNVPASEDQYAPVKTAASHSCRSHSFTDKATLTTNAT